MAGKGKGFVWQDYQIAYETVWKGLVELDAPIGKTNTHPFEPVYLLRGDTMESLSPSPEESFLKEEAFSSLSAEAKEVVQLVLGAPQEIIECFMAPKYNKISRNKVAEFLVERMGWKRKVVNRCFEELREFAENLR